MRRIAIFVAVRSCRTAIARWAFAGVVLCLALFAETAWAQAAWAQAPAFDFEGKLGPTRGTGTMIPSTRGGFVIVPESAPYVDMSDEELVLFGRNSSEISPRAESVLDRLGVTLSTGALSGYNVQIEGHTCNLGSTDYNQLLSEERARSVKRYLARKFGIDGTRIRSVGYGETRPKLENLSERYQANNRRVRVVRLEENDGNRVLTMAEFEESRARAVTRGVAGSLMDAELWGMSAGGQQLRPIQNGDAISSGGLLKVRIRVNEGCHLYVIAHSSTGKSTLLLPNPDEELANHGR